MQDNQQKNLRIILPLLVIALMCAILIWTAHELTREKIRDNARIYKLRLIESVITLPHNNNLYDDFIEVVDPAWFGSDQPVSVFRVRQDEQAAGIVLTPVRARGYSGSIDLTIGIAVDGTIMGVRVLKHNETEGLGDRIDHEKSDWIKQFDGHSLENIPVEKWSVAVDGGKFDALSGATITSRSVVNAVRKSLEYYSINRDKLYQILGHKETE